MALDPLEPENVLRPVAVEEVVWKLTFAVLVASCSICCDMRYDVAFRASMDSTV
jgi:hypothetical protein